MSGELTSSGEGGQMHRPNCPSTEEWGLYAAGILPTSRAVEMTEHASTCDACGPLLADVCAEESAAVPLRSGTEEWQREMAEKLAEMSSAVPETSKVVPFPQRSRAWLAAAALLIAMVGGASLWQYLADRRANSPKEALTLLVRAYPGYRTLDLRLPGAEYGPPRLGQRGGGKASLEGRPPLLLEGEARITRGATSGPEDDEWMVDRALADLMEMDYADARATLEKVSRDHPERDDVRFDLAMSCYVSAYSGEGASEYGRAAEILSQLLQRHPTEKAALFNLALTYERLQMPDEAKQQWERLLTIEARGGWADEARRHLGALGPKLNRRDAQHAGGDVANAEPGQPQVFDALRKWRDALRNDQGDAEIEDLARTMVTRYGDWWLSDVMRETKSSPAGALDDLMRAELANRRGDPDAAIGAATRAVAGFQKSGNQAGAERAQYELLYAFQRSSQPGSCVLTGERLLAAIDPNRSPWLRAQTLLDLAGCANMTSDFDGAEHWTAESMKDSAAHNFRILHLRALGVHAGSLTKMGNWREAWQADLDGLGEFWAGDYPAARAYQFYYDMSISAEEHGLMLLARAMADEAAIQIGRTGNITVEGLARSRLGRLDLEAMDLAGAKKELTAADKLFGSVAPGATLALYRADSEIGMSRVETAEGRPAEAAKRLEAVLPDLKGFGNRPEVVRYFRALAEAEEQQGKPDAAEHALHALIAVSEAALSSIPLEHDRLIWAHELDAAYRGVVRLKLAKGETWQALDLWQWYRAIASRVAVKGEEISIPDPVSLESFRVPVPADWARTLARGMHRGTMITFVQMNDGVAVWVFDDRGGVFRWIPTSRGGVGKLAGKFEEVCEQRTPDDATLRFAGAGLYRTFIVPLESQLSPDRVVLIDADGPLARVPFRALPISENTYLGDRYEIVTSPGIYGYREDSSGFSEASRRVVVVGSPFLDTGATAQFPPLPDALAEASDVAALFPNHVLLTGPAANKGSVRAALYEATLFHFAGHALSSGAQVGLVLASTHPEENWEQSLLSARDISAGSLRQCRLVVLSACATSPMTEWGVSEPDSLARGLLSAGVREVIATRWPVDSAATHQFMAEFYAGWKQSDSVPVALRSASMRLRRSRSTKEPYYWAAFEVFGNP